MDDLFVLDTGLAPSGFPRCPLKGRSICKEGTLQFLALDTLASMGTGDRFLGLLTGRTGAAQPLWLRALGEPSTAGKARARGTLLGARVQSIPCLPGRALHWVQAILAAAVAGARELSERRPLLGRVATMSRRVLPRLVHHRMRDTWGCPTWWCAAGAWWSSVCLARRCRALAWRSGRSGGHCTWDSVCSFYDAALRVWCLDVRHLGLSERLPRNVSTSCGIQRRLLRA